MIFCFCEILFFMQTLKYFTWQNKLNTSIEVLINHFKKNIWGQLGSYGLINALQNKYLRSCFSINLKVCVHLWFPIVVFPSDLKFNIKFKLNFLVFFTFIVLHVKLSLCAYWYLLSLSYAPCFPKSTNLIYLIWFTFYCLLIYNLK